ncbi:MULTISPECIES: aminopeptidase N [unclassified Cyanobium]|uniref:aminopeptidase N n=1 Tax=unclassified Cyanobium TaxID=2627006 RepID=UPI0020CDD3F8|nr:MULTISPECIES: aminopeptidase N [unclassified Cyanobium]MCP9777238.1 aminopeptidase N [Cyanobium sp. Tous-M-B4]MCP9877752.1 aminopeptidase N [Cyanobium sp. A2C-AMD]
MPLVRLADYRPAPYLLERTDLTVQLHSGHTEVLARLAFLPNPLAQPGPLVLQGVDLELLELRLDGELLPAEAFELSDDQLVITQPPAGVFQLQSRVRIHPETNSTLEGLYASGGLFTTQCEAEGFRRITFHPDRPDLLSRFQVRIEADRASCPVLLSNGNCLDSGDLDDGRHFAVWDDPFPKPSYLFALVAGQLEEVKDSFTTASGRAVALRIHVEPGDAPYTAHAMASLKRSMAWDEQRYGLEYDLDEFNIVAVRHFNMGAMENKSLNIFNSKLVLADAETATDGELERIESVIAHEYFHNWTGNRITCRDWFQLSLKEGLTVFRDQSFTEDMHGAALNRIENVSMLRNSQFREDAGPTAHPVQPDAYQAIDNFYTTTIYEKGSELIRMLHTLLGEEAFMRGMALYVSRHDGTAATCEDFVQAMQDAAPVPPPFDFAQFRRWYHQAGTPRLHIQRHWDGEAGVLELQVQQHTPATPGQSEKQPLVIPLALGFLGQGGESLPVRLEGEPAPARLAGDGTRLLVIDQPQQTLRLVGLPQQHHPPALSLLRHFSAPVILEMGRPTAELVHLLAADSDPFARWDAGQVLLRQAVLARAAGSADGLLEEELIDAFGRILADPSLSEASRSVLLALPGLPELEDAAVAIGAEPDPPALFAALLALQQRFGAALAVPLTAALERCTPQWSLAWPAGNGDRLLTGTVWSWRVAAGDAQVAEAAAAAVQGPSMTLARAGLRALQCHPIAERQQAVEAFYQRWQHKPVILDAWFALEASAPFADGLERVARLLEHPRFDPAAPNSVRAVLGGLAGNTAVFHAADGSGYRFMAARIADLDQRNPITASRLAKVFSRWQSYGPARSAAMRAALEQLAAAPLSPNTGEVVSQCLGAD